MNNTLLEHTKDSCVEAANPGCWRGWMLQEFLGRTEIHCTCSQDSLWLHLLPMVLNHVRQYAFLVFNKERWWIQASNNSGHGLWQRQVTAWVGGGGICSSLGAAALIAHCALANTVFYVLAACVTLAEHGGGHTGGAPLRVVLLAEAADHFLHGAVHVLIFVRVDNRVHDRVKQRQQQEPPFHMLHATLCAVKAIQKQHHQARRPAHHKCP